MTAENYICGYGIDSDGNCYMIEVQKSGTKRCMVVCLNDYEAVYRAFENIREMADVFAIKALIKIMDGAKGEGTN